MTLHYGPEAAEMFRRSGGEGPLRQRLWHEFEVRDAGTLGFRVIMVADANAARRDQDHNATLHTVYRTFGDVRPTVEVLELIRAGYGS